jgi:hypothetical protein
MFPPNLVYWRSAFRTGTLFLLAADIVVEFAAAILAAVAALVWVGAIRHPKS